jgi:hypothetical protein
LTLAFLVNVAHGARNAIYATLTMHNVAFARDLDPRATLRMHTVHNVAPTRANEANATLCMLARGFDPSPYKPAVRAPATAAVRASPRGRGQTHAAARLKR